MLNNQVNSNMKLEDVLQNVFALQGLKANPMLISGLEYLLVPTTQDHKSSSLHLTLASSFPCSLALGNPGRMQYSTLRSRVADAYMDYQRKANRGHGA